MRQLPPHINLTDFVDNAKVLPTKELAQIYGVSKRSIRHYKEWCRHQGHLPLFPPSPTPDFTDFLKINAARYMVIGDAEIPDYNAPLMQHALEVAQEHDLKVLFINGDFLALDSFSNWARDLVYSGSFNKDKDLATKVLEVLCTWFEKIYLITGNHERRLAKKVEGHITVKDFFDGIAPGIHMSEYAYAEINEATLICHPDNYSKIPLRNPNALATIKLMNVISGHTHHLAQGWHESGKFWIVESGCMRDPQKTEYKQMRCNKFPAWNPGFVTVINGYPRIYHESYFQYN